VSKSSRWSFAGIVPHCNMTAAPRHRRMCSSISVAVRPLIFSPGYSVERPSWERTILSRLSASQSSFRANERKLCSSCRRSRISPGSPDLSAYFAQSDAFDRNLSDSNMLCPRSGLAPVCPAAACIVSSRHIGTASQDCHRFSQRLRNI